MFVTYITLTAALSALAGAQTIPGLPECASSCVTDFGDCGPVDVECICASDTLISDLACCVSTACDEADQETTIEFANNLCGGEGVDDLPQSATCAGDSGSSSTTSSASEEETGDSDMTMTESGDMTMTSDAMGAATDMPSETTSESEDEDATPTPSESEESGTEESATPEQTDNAGAVNEKTGALGLGLVVAGVMAAL